MRPETAYRKVMKAFEFWYKDKDTSKLYEARSAIKKLIEKDRMYWVTRPKDEWYIDYDKMLSEIKSHTYDNSESELMYISDRFYSTSRLSWLYHGLITKQL